MSKTLIFFIIMSYFALNENMAFAANSYQPGFRTSGAWLADQELRLELNIWHPGLRQPQDARAGSWKTHGALNSRPVAGKFPLIIVSHPSSGGRFSYSALCAWLASQGYVVAAPRHEKDNMDNMDNLFTWKQLESRVKEISASIGVLFADSEIGPIIDRERVGIAGFGSGGSAALLLGGAMPNCALWQSYCGRASKLDPYCSFFAVEKINLACKNFPLAKSMADTRIKAIAAIAPGHGMFFDSASFQFFFPPLLLASAGKDAFNSPELHSGSMSKILGKRARLLDLPLADQGALMDKCPEFLSGALPGLCESVSDSQRQYLRRILEDSLLSFFNHYLVKNLPVIPNPPDFSQKPAGASKPQKNPVSRKKTK